MSCGVGCRRSSDPALLWLWHRLAATAPIGPLAWEAPYATGAALEKAKRQKKKEREREKRRSVCGSIKAGTHNQLVESCLNEKSYWSDGASVGLECSVLRERATCHSRYTNKVE